MAARTSRPVLLRWPQRMEQASATLGILLVIAAAGIVALKAFAKDVLPDGVPWTLVASWCLGPRPDPADPASLTIGGGGTGVSVGPGWSAYILRIATAALTYFAFTLFQASGQKMPDMNKKDTAAPPAA